MDNPDLRSQYDDIWRDTMRAVTEQGFAWDDQIASPHDTRYGITLRLRPSAKVRRRISALLSEFDQLEPGHHVYPESEMHVTVLSILTAKRGFTLDQIDSRRYVVLLGDCLAYQPAFTLRFCGVTASPSCVMVQGYDEDGGLGQVRDRVRAAFKSSSLPHTIDQRYRVTLAHSTVLRFNKPVRDPTAVLALIERHRDTELGAWRVEALELVGNDWYHSSDRLVMLSKYDLAQSQAT